MRTLALAVLLALTVLAVAPGMEATAAPCNGKPPAEIRKCTYQGSEVYACGKRVLNLCIWGP